MKYFAKYEGKEIEFNWSYWIEPQMLIFGKFKNGKNANSGLGIAIDELDMKSFRFEEG